MLIDRVASQLLSAPELSDSLRNLRDGKDMPLALGQSARPLMVIPSARTCHGRSRHQMMPLLGHVVRLWSD